jgi:hypothetical protein
MRRLIPVVALLALAPTALAAGSRGVVLLVKRRAHVAEVVTAGGVVHGYRLAPGAPRLGFGSRISFAVSNATLSAVRVAGKTVNRVSFQAVVTGVASDLVSVRLSDGTAIRVSPTHRSGSTNSTSGRVSRPHPADMPRLSAGDAVLVTETRLRGGLTVTVRKLGRSGRGAGSGSGSNGGGPAPGATSGPPAGETAAGGVIVETDAGSIKIQLPDGSTLSPALPAGALGYFTQNDDLSVCETVSIGYHPGAAGPELDDLVPTGISTSAAISIAGGDTCAALSDGTGDVVGTITSIASASVTLDVPGIGSEAFALDPAAGLTDGNELGDLVDVTFDPAAGNPASDVEWSEAYATGTVTSVGANALKLEDAVTGLTETFAPADASFHGVSIGDRVGIVYWVSAGDPQADDVEQLAAG